MKWIIRQTVDHSLTVEADSKELAQAKAENTPIEEWDSVEYGVFEIEEAK